ncbi:hypothetical protein BHM03_00024282 [Ensete ventricosum]|nr:hypothetical protein BHM03_00024282 [Ensete ventricosum]
MPPCRLFLCQVGRTVVGFAMSVSSRLYCSGSELDWPSWVAPRLDWPNWVA